jgi:hypothetical protein
MRTVLMHLLFLDAAWYRLVDGYQNSRTCHSHLQVLSYARSMMGAGGCVGDGVRYDWFGSQEK